MQLSRGSVSVTNGSTTVRGLYVTLLTGGVGAPFDPAEAISWGAGGVGVVSRHDAVGGWLYFARTAGPAPVALDVISNGGATKTGTVASLASTSVPDFATELAGPGGPKLFTVYSSGVFYSVASAAVDSIVLTGAYAAASELEADYAIIRDFTTYFGWPIPAPNDSDVGSILTRSFTAVDAAIYGPAKTTPTLDSGWVNHGSSAIAYWKDSDRVVHLSGAGINALGSTPSTIFTLPVGYRPLYAQRVPIIVGTTSMGVVEIATTGVVSVVSGAMTVAVYLDGITFRGDA